MTLAIKTFATELQSVTCTRREEIGAAALALRRAVEGRLGDWRVAPCATLTSQRPMEDHEGRPLARDYFGWAESGPDAWWRKPRLALESPLPEACRYESEPMWCNAAGFHSLLENPLLAQIDMSDFPRRSWCRAAIVIPVHMPFGRIGAAGLVPCDTGLTDLSQPFATFAAELAQLCRQFIVSHTRVTGDLSRLPVGVSLSPREVECLRWAAVGKTDLEISMIISRSRATIRFHIHNAVTKLNAVSRSQAVFKAAQLGYINLAH